MIVDILLVVSEKIKELDIDTDEIVVDYKAYLHLFSNVKDFRQEGKVIYPLEDLLMIILICIFEMGKVSYLAIADRIYTKRKEFKALGLIQDIERLPSHDTIRRVLSSLDSDSLLEETLNGFYNFLKSLERNVKKDHEYIHTGIDGKENCGSGRHKDTQNPKSNTGHLNVLDTSTMTCLFSDSYDKKDSEVKLCQDILEKMDLKRRLITADALHCQRKTTDIIASKRGKYLLCVKENQRLLYEEIITRFSKYRYSTHKIEERTIDIYHLPKNYSTDGFKGMKCFVRMTNIRGKSKYRRYFITNSSDEELIIEGLLQRWRIENNLHNTKDVFLGEDRFHGTDIKANKNVTILNNIAVQLVYILKSITNEELRRCKDRFKVYPLDTISLILSFMASEDIIDKLVTELKKEKKRPR